MRKILLTLLTVLALATPGRARDGFAIVIDPESYRRARAEVEAYAQAIEQVNGLKVYVVEDRWMRPDSIRAELKRLHGRKDSPIAGCVLVGDIPIAMIRDAQHLTSAFKMSQTTARKESSVPSDRYYDDFGLDFKYLDCDTDAPYFYYSLTPQSRQRLRPDIFSGRIRPTDEGGTSRYDKLKAFLLKATAAKKQTRRLENIFFFSGHGYISESKVARMDEKASYYEHFPWLSRKRNVISYMDHSDHNPIKERLMNELMRTDLDFALLHHHGYWDTEYLNGLREVRTVREAKEFIIRNCREHLYTAKQRGKNYDSLSAEFQKKFDLPASWLEDAVNDSTAIADSLYEASADLHLEDFQVYGYRPNVPVVIIDACFCGSYHKDNCIADQYIFQPGGTVAVVANTVNALQDKWSDHLIGLLGRGACVGNLPRFAGYLESHVVGDPTYRFTPEAGSADLEHLLLENRTATWKKLLSQGTPDEQVLSIEMLYRSGATSSAQLLQTFRTSPYGIVRLKAFLTLINFKDNNAVKAIIEASQDSYELLQRLAIRHMAAVGDGALVPALIKLSIANNTSDRCNFNAMNALSCYPKDELLKEFARQFDNDSVRYIKKDSIRALIERTIVRCTERMAGSIDALLKPETTAKQKMYTLRALRNTLPHYKVPVLLEFLRQNTDESLQIAALECMGWHSFSVKAADMARAAEQLSNDNSQSEAVRAEALKTVNRLHEK